MIISELGKYSMDYDSSLHTQEDALAAFSKFLNAPHLTIADVDLCDPSYQNQPNLRRIVWKWAKHLRSIDIA